MIKQKLIIAFETDLGWHCGTGLFVHLILLLVMLLLLFRTAHAFLALSSMPSEDPFTTVLLHQRFLLLLLCYWPVPLLLGCHHRYGIHHRLMSKSHFDNDNRSRLAGCSARRCPHCSCWLTPLCASLVQFSSHSWTKWVPWGIQCCPDRRRKYS